MPPYPCLSPEKGIPLHPQSGSSFRRRDYITLAIRSNVTESSGTDLLSIINLLHTLRPVWQNNLEASLLRWTGAIKLFVQDEQTDYFLPCLLYRPDFIHIPLHRFSKAMRILFRALRSSCFVSCAYQLHCRLT